MIVWDEAKRKRNLKTHGIDLAELGCVFDAPMVTVEDERENMANSACKVWAGITTSLSSWFGLSAMNAPE